MKKDVPLFLHEELLLLALRDAEGTIAGNTMWGLALGGAALAELLLAERIRIDESRRNKLVDLVDSSPLGEPYLDECLGRIGAAKRRAGASTWVSRFANAKNLKHRIASSLCRRGILREKEDRVLLLFTRRIYPERDPKWEKAVIERLRRAIFTNARDIDARTVVLVSLANRTGLLKTAFDKKTLKARKKRIEQIVNGELTGKATQAAVEAMLAAVVVACIFVPVIVT